MTIEEYFEEEGLEDYLDNAAEQSQYWSDAVEFIRNHWRSEMNDLTNKQKQWAIKIQEDLTELKIMGKLK